MQGVLHRNITPSCILFDRNGTAKLSDFLLDARRGAGDGDGDHAAKPARRLATTSTNRRRCSSTARSSGQRSLHGGGLALRSADGPAAVLAGPGSARADAPSSTIPYRPCATSTGASRPRSRPLLLAPWPRSPRSVSRPPSVSCEALLRDGPVFPSRKRQREELFVPALARWACAVKRWNGSCGCKSHWGREVDHPKAAEAARRVTAYGLVQVHRCVQRISLWA